MAQTKLRKTQYDISSYYESSASNIKTNGSPASIGVLDTFARTDHMHLGREMITKNRTYYVSGSGNDSNSGLTSDSAFLTIQKAIDTAASIDTSIYNITIQVADGTYVSNTITCKNIIGSGEVIITGNTTTPANCIIDGGFSKTTAGTKYTVQGFKLIKSSGTAVIAFSTSNAAEIAASYINFGAGFTYHVYAGSKSFFTFATSYTISGSATNHIFCRDAATVTLVNGIAITLSGSITFTCFAYCVILGIVVSAGLTFSGSATGARYSVATNGVIYTNGGGANYFPGSTAGTAATGGLYV